MAMGWREFFQYNTGLEKRLFLLIAVLSGVLLVLFIYLLASSGGIITCKSSECIRAASFIIDKVDPTIDPCDDFYNFACGTFLKNADSLGTRATLDSLDRVMESKLKKIITETADERNMSRILRLQRKFYRACTNEKDIERGKNEAFLGLLNELMGGWPIIKNHRWIEENFEWKATMMKARQMGLFFEFFFRVEMYFNSNETYTLWIRPPSKENISSFYWEDEDNMTDIATRMGANTVETRSNFRRVIQFANLLKGIVEKYENAIVNRSLSEIRRIPIQKLDHPFVKINWLKFLRNITGVPLHGNELVIFDVKEYFHELYYLLFKTQKKVQANYMAWIILSTNIDYLSKDIREQYKEMVRCKTKTTTNITRSERCFRISKGLFPDIAEGEYIRRYTPPEKQKLILEMANNIKHQLMLALERNKWMDAGLKESKIKYLRSINTAVGWIKIVFNPHNFHQYLGYDQVKMASHNLTDMARALAKHGVNRYYKRLNYTTEEIMASFLNRPHLQVNAYYLRYLRTVILLTPLTQGFMYNDGRPRYMNYGSLGSVIGHELTHGITEEYKETDSKEQVSISNATRLQFVEATKCLVDEYDVYPDYLTGFSNNGSIALIENLADITGINLAYTAYRDWARYGSRELSLPGIKYTPRQVFWIMATSFLCYDPTDKRDGKYRQLHATPKFRALTRVRNSPYFANDFGCPVGSKMNPEKKCRVFT